MTNPDIRAGQLWTWTCRELVVLITVLQGLDDPTGRPTRWLRTYDVPIGGRAEFTMTPISLFGNMTLISP